jgi:hypothetical protein
MAAFYTSFFSSKFSSSIAELNFNEMQRKVNIWLGKTKKHGQTHYS